MGFLNRIRSCLKKADFFCTTQLLRYESQSEYGTAFGGLGSITVIIMLAIIFYYKLMACFYKEDITSTQSTKISEDPTPFTISTYPQSNFMLAVNIDGINLNTQKRYFNVKVWEKSNQYNYVDAKWNTRFRSHNLEPCLKTHWQKWPQIQKYYDIWGMSSWLCLPTNKKFNIQGSWLSDKLDQLTIQIGACFNSSDDKKPCATKAQIDIILDSQSQFISNLYYINPSINPNDKNYITYYLDDNSYMFFRKNQGTTGNLLIEDYEITTDESIIPMTMEKVEKDGMITQSIRDLNYQIEDGSSNYNFVRFVLMKSRVSRIYTRSFLKLDQVFGLIGGLFGTVSLFLLFLSSYNNYAYEIALCSTLFRLQDKSPVKNLTSYNFFSYIVQYIHEIITFIGFSLKWEAAIEYNKCHAEMKKQLDISYLLERIQYLESVASTVLDRHQLKGLHMRQKMSLSIARKKRRAFKMNKKMNEVRKKLKKMSSLNSSNDRFSVYPENIEMMIQKNQILAIQNTNHKLYPEPSSNMKRKEESQDDEINLSETQSEDSTDEKKEDLEKEALNDLVQLKDQALSGNKMSQKVWNITNKSISSVIPDLFSSDSKGFLNLRNKVTNRNNFSEAQHSNKTGLIVSNDYTDPISVERIRPYKVKKQGEQSSRNTSN